MPWWGWAITIPVLVIVGVFARIVWVALTIGD